MTEVQRLVYGMLTEGTGKAMGDSGFGDNRGWQRNQKKTIEDFNNEDDESYEFDFQNGEVTRTVSVFHYLTNNLELDEVCNEFNEIQVESNDWDSDVYGVSRNAFDHIDAFFDTEIERTWNTYNGDSDLSQILQGASVVIDEEHYVLIQIHNGADARAGYTDAKLFKLGEEYVIHEYLQEYKDWSEIQDDIEEGYIETFTDYSDDSKTYTNEEIKNRLNEL